MLDKSHGEKAVLKHAQLTEDRWRRQVSHRGMELGMDPSLIARLNTLAATQHSLFTIRQAHALNITSEALAVAVERGWLRRPRRSVYAFAGHPPSRWEPIMAAALAAGPNAVVSHASAAMIHGFSGVIADRPHLTLPIGSRRRLTGVCVHRCRLDPQDVEARSGVGITRPVRTVIDMAGSTGDFLLGRILDEGTIERLWTAERVAARLDRLGGAGRAGTVRLRRLLAERTGEARVDSRLEQRVLRVLKGNVPARPSSSLPNSAGRPADRHGRGLAGLPNRWGNRRLSDACPAFAFRPGPAPIEPP